MKRLLPLSALTLAACATAGLSLSPAAARGQALAGSNCATCHAVGRDAGQSPNPQAPPFELIANQPGLTRETLGTFLRDAHNYPGAMQFTLDPAAADDLAAYMLTLRRDDYHPPI